MRWRCRGQAADVRLPEGPPVVVRQEVGCAGTSIRMRKRTLQSSRDWLDMRERERGRERGLLQSDN